MSRVPPRTVELVQERDGGCVRCGRWGGNTHHRKLRSQASKQEVHLPQNLIVLCGSGTTGCHGWVHANPAESYRNGWLVQSWQAPEEVPVRYAGGHKYTLTDRFTRLIQKENVNG